MPSGCDHCPSLDNLSCFNNWYIWLLQFWSLLSFARRCTILRVWGIKTPEYSFHSDLFDSDPLLPALIEIWRIRSPIEDWSISQHSSPPSATFFPAASIPIPYPTNAYNLIATGHLPDICLENNLASLRKIIFPLFHKTPRCPYQPPRTMRRQKPLLLKLPPRLRASM